jgi:hypothetical protein
MHPNSSTLGEDPPAHAGEIWVAGELVFHAR